MGQEDERHSRPDDHAEIIAALHAGEDPASVEKRFGVTRQEIGWLLSRHHRTPPTSAGSERPRPPTPVVVVTALFAIVAVTPFIVTVVTAAVAWNSDLVPVLIINAVFAGVFGLVPLGLWQGRRGALIMAIIAGVLTVPCGLAIILPLVLPASAQAWLNRGGRT